MKKVVIFAILMVILPVTVLAISPLYDINQKVCNRFEEDTARLAAVMDELRSRKGITETRVAFGGIDTPVKSADYWINFAAEAIAYQRAQKYGNAADLRSGLAVLANKVVKAKQAVGKALDGE